MTKPDEHPYHCLSEIGATFVTQKTFSILIDHPDNKKETWAERKRYELLLKLRKRVATINLLYATLIIFAGIALTILGILYIISRFHGFLIGFACGYAGVQLMRLIIVITLDKFPTNAWEVKINRK